MRDEMLSLRLSPTEAKALRKVAKAMGAPSRSEAVRRLIVEADDATVRGETESVAPTTKRRA